MILLIVQKFLLGLFFHFHLRFLYSGMPVKQRSEVYSITDFSTPEYLALGAVDYDLETA